MGRELRRVPLDFKWPLHKPWAGFTNNPWYAFSWKCEACDGNGSNPATKEIYEDFYGKRYTDGWRDKITEDECQALISEGRLMDFTHTWDGTEKDPKKRWKPLDPMPAISDLTRIVNEANSPGGRRPPGCFGHDAINMWILVETRAKRLGVYGKCPECKGDGTIWVDKRFEKKAERWKDTPPPEGPGWQLWETVSEGSPITPVFANPEDLADWLVENDTSVTMDTTKAQWLKFMGVVEGVGGRLIDTGKGGWAPSMVSGGGHGIRSGVKALTEDQA